MGGCHVFWTQYNSFFWTRNCHPNVLCRAEWVLLRAKLGIDLRPHERCPLLPTSFIPCFSGSFSEFPSGIGFILLSSSFPLGSSVWVLHNNQVEPGSFIYFQLRKRGESSTEPRTSLSSWQEQVALTGPMSLVLQPRKLVLAPGFALNRRVFVFFNFMESLSNIIFECPSDSQWTRTLLGHDGTLPSQFAAGNQEDKWVCDSGAQASNAEQRLWCLTQSLTPPEPQDFICSSYILEYIYREVDKWD